MEREIVFAVSKEETGGLDPDVVDIEEDRAATVCMSVIVTAMRCTCKDTSGWERG